MNKNVFLTGLTLAVIMSMSACGPKTINTSIEIGNASTHITTAIQTVATITDPITKTAVTVTPLPTTTTIAERNIVYANRVVEYSVPVSWTEVATETGIKYYYPKDSMLMVIIEETDWILTNESTGNEYLTRFLSGMEKFEELGKAEITVAGTQAYHYDINFKLDGSKFTGSIVIFNYNNGIVSFMIGTKLESDKDYRKKFENIINSVKFIDGSNTPGETEEEELNAALKTVEGHFITDVVLKGNKTEKWISFEVDSSVIKELSDYEKSSEVRETWEIVKHEFKDISEDLSASFPGYTLRMINPLNSAKILLTLSYGEVTYDYYADLIAEDTD